MNKAGVIEETKNFAQKRLANENSGHDWWHTFRVWKMAKRLTKEERGDLFVVELSALLHDVEDWKHHEGDESINKNIIKEWLHKHKIEGPVISRVCYVIGEATFRGEASEKKVKSREGAILFDADQLDSIGAIGIARGFMFAGNFKLPMHDPRKKSLRNMSEKKYKNFKRSEYTQINHFYEKLLLLKDLMNTKTGKKIAMERHSFMKQYLKKFFGEWEGKI